MRYLVLLLLSFNIQAADLIMPVKGVYDGDTFYTELCALPDPLRKVSVRILGIDTPEIRGDCDKEKALAKQAKDKLVELLAGHQEVLVKNVEWDKYGGRIDGNVFLPDNVSIADEMIKSGFARPYTGGTRQGWCQ